MRAKAYYKIEKQTIDKSIAYLIVYTIRAAMAKRMYEKIMVNVRF
jgi:hypothetical protein